jgi:acetyl esterase/lipase
LLDVFVNADASAKKPAPVLIDIHGGGWNHGARQTVAHGFNRFYAMGFSVVSVDYRLTPVAPAPAAVVDSLCALSWVQANAKKYNFDTSRIVVHGGSAGGHLALMLGMLPANTDIADPACGPLPRVAAVLDFYGPSDLVQDFTGTWRQPSVLSWIGNVSDPAALAKKMSPITYVRPGVPPVFIAHGDADHTVPPSQSIELKAALDAAKVPNYLYWVHGAGHGKFTPDEETKTYLLVRAFLAQQKIVAP